VQQRLCDKLRRKIETTKASSDFELRGKLFRYALCQGYDYDQINQAIAQVVDGFDG
jgi:SOS response regulatory protein OraA/RecX